MEPKKEKWINDILNSADGIQRADPNPFLFAKIRNRLQDEPATAYVSMRTLWLTIASFALLVLLNWRIIYQPSNASSSQSGDLSTLITDMNLFPTRNQLY
ncbi:hypothetical protein GCM10028805_12950 [Spirosoma harenae]